VLVRTEGRKKNVHVTFWSNCLARLYKLLRQQAILARLSIRDLID